MTYTRTGNPPGRPKGRHPRVRFRFPPIVNEMIRDAARLYGWPVEKWVENVLSYEAMRVRIAASNLPHGLHPKSVVYRVTSAPIQGPWAYREWAVATGAERVLVTQFLDDAPKTISEDERAVVIDVLNGARNLVTAYKNIRWIGANPLTHHLFAQQPADDGEA